MYKFSVYKNTISHLDDENFILASSKRDPVRLIKTEENNVLDKKYWFKQVANITRNRSWLEFTTVLTLTMDNITGYIS